MKRTSLKAKMIISVFIFALILYMTDKLDWGFKEFIYIILIILYVSLLLIIPSYGNQFIESIKDYNNTMNVILIIPFFIYMIIKFPINFKIYFIFFVLFLYFKFSKKIYFTEVRERKNLKKKDLGLLFILL